MMSVLQIYVIYMFWNIYHVCGMSMTWEILISKDGGKIHDLDFSNKLQRFCIYERKQSSDVNVFLL